MQIPLLSYLNVPYALQTLLLFDKSLTTIPTATPVPSSQSSISSSSPPPPPIDTVSMSPIAPTSADWKPLLSSALSQNPVNFFQLATVSSPLVPRCRTLTLSGFLGEIPPVNPKDVAAEEAKEQEAEGGAKSSSTVLISASHSHSSKFHDLTMVSQSAEAVFFFPKLWTQWRVRGKAYPISYGGVGGGDLEAVGRRAAEAQLVAAGEGWSWDGEVRKVWERLDGKLKLKYGPVTEEEPVPKDFRLVVLVPEEVEQLSAGDGTLVTWTARAEEGLWVKSKL